MGTTELIEQKQSELETRVECLSVFGSALWEDFDPENSDLDFAVTFMTRRPEDHAAAYFGVLEDLETLFDRSVDLIETEAVRNPYLHREIEAGQRILYVAA